MARGLRLTEVGAFVKLLPETFVRRVTAEDQHLTRLGPVDAVCHPCHRGEHSHGGGAGASILRSTVSLRDIPLPPTPGCAGLLPCRTDVLAVSVATRRVDTARNEEAPRSALAAPREIPVAGSA